MAPRSIALLLIVVLCQWWTLEGFHCPLKYAPSRMITATNAAPASAQSLPQSTAEAYFDKPATYKSISVLYSENRKVTLLVDERSTEIWNKLTSLSKTKTYVSQEMIDEWIAKRLVFPLSGQGMTLLYQHEKSVQQQHFQAMVTKAPPFKSNSKFVDLRSFVNYGTEKDPIYIRREKTADISREDLKKPEVVEKLTDSYQIFTDISELFSVEKVLVRAEDIAIKMKQNYDMTSRQYQTWIEKSMVTNETSFTQAIASYLKEHTIADVGTVRGGYRPLRGFPGTLAAGERFLENYSLKDMPKKVVHPWPALQEILFHGRMPVTHPFIPQVPVWGALNGKYSRVIVDQALKNPPAEIRGGSRMLQNDAIYIALKHHKGECFDPKIQLRHGGNVYDSGFDIPNYQTDHGPTVSQEEADIIDPPEELMPFLYRWLDPLFGVGSLLDTKMDEDAEVKEEKAIRAELAKKFLKDQLPLTSKAIDTEVKNRNAVVEGFVEQRMKAHADRIKQLRLRSQAEDDLNEVEQELSKELLAKTEKSDFIKMMTMLEDSKKKSIVVDENYAKARVFVKPYNFAADEPLEFKREEFRTQANTLANEEDYMASTRSRGQLITYAVTMVSNMIEEDNRLLREPPVSGKAKKKARKVRKPPTKRGKKAADSTMEGEGLGAFEEASFEE